MYFQTATQNPLGWRSSGLSGPARRPLRSSSPLRSLPSRSAASLTRRRRFLGDDASVLAAALAAGGSGAPSAANVSQAVQQAMNGNALWTSENCSGIVSSGSTASLVLSAGGSAAVSWGTKALAAGAISGPLAPIVLIAGAAMEVFGAIYAHHAAKVKQEQQIICAVVQAVNDSLSVIDQAVQQGAITPAQAGPSLDKLYSDLVTNVQPILKQDSGDCNAACFVLAMARGVIGKKKELYGKIMPVGAPPGPYQQTCQYVSVQGNIVSALCPDSTGKMMQTSFQPICACNSLANTNGNLTCSAPTTCSPAADPSDPTAGVSSLVDQLAGSFNVPSWAVWGIGGLLTAKLVGVI